MKLAFIFFILLHISPFAFGSDIQTLNRNQIRLQNDYQILLEDVGDLAAQIRQNEVKLIAERLEKIESFFSEYDQYNLTKIDFFMENTLQGIHSRYFRVGQHMKKSELKKATNMLYELMDFRTEYLEKKVHFGKALDYSRVVAGTNFFVTAGKTASYLRKIEGDITERKWGTKLLPFIDNGKEFAPLADDFLRLLWASWFRTKNNAPNQAPIVDSLRKISLEIAKEKGTKAEWRGMENLGTFELDGETLNILVFMHANSYFDTSVQALLPLEGLSSIGNVDIIFPKFLAKRMHKSDHIVTVGHGDTMKKTVDLVRNRKLNKFFVAPEGLTPVGLYEMRPLVEDFAEAIYEILDRELKINLYPISFPENFRFLNDYRKPVEGDKLAYGVIHPVLTEIELKMLLKITGKKQSAASLIRWIWFNDLINNYETVLSMPSPTRMHEWLEGMLWGDL